MAYATGTANTLADLLAAIQNACTANGWALSAANVLSKGGCFTEVKISGAVILVQGGSGVDGSGNLTGRSNYPAPGMCRTVGFSPPGAFTYPVTYFIHVMTNPDEVYVYVNYATSYYQWLAFGKSAMPGLTGTGNWFAASFSNFWSVSSSPSQLDIGTGKPYNQARPMLLNDASYNGGNGAVDHQLDSATWTIDGSYRDWGVLTSKQPSAWNNEAVLLPIRVYANRPSGFVSPVLECAHARLTDLRYLSDLQVITLGTDKWKVYPWFTRGTDANTTSLTFAHALRYDGP